MIKVDGKKGIYAEVVADSISKHGERLITFRLHYPRIIHAEVMTHRMFSRNASSSRAIPVNKVLEQVQTTPAMPVQFGKNQAGMQDAGEFDNKIGVSEWDDYENDMVTKYYTPEEYWGMSAESASQFAQSFSDAGYHKQVANRLVEPYQYMNTIISMTDTDNFWHLRLHKDADPTFVNLTECMYNAYNQSDPDLVTDGDYHLPFIQKMRFENDSMNVRYFVEGEEVSLETAIKVSISVCCQVSYRKSDLSIEKAIKIYDMLVTMSPIHASPLEHIAKPFTDDEWNVRTKINNEIREEGLLGVNALYCGNFRGWEQYRKSVPFENITDFSGGWE